jgi:hypothetical protein
MYQLYTRIIYKLLLSSVCLNSRQKEAEIISEILLRAASEPDFRNVLVKDPGNVLAQYNVSPEARLIITRSIVDLTQ